MAKRKIRNLFRNSQGKWCIDITVKKRRVIRVIGISRREAEDVLAVIKADLLRGKLGIGPSAKSVLFKDFSEKFLQKHSSLKRSGWRDRLACEKHLTPRFGNMVLADIKLERIEEYKAARKATTTLRKDADGKPKETSGATVNRELALLRTILNKAVEWEYLDASPINWRRVEKFNENGRERYLTADERERLFAALDDSGPILRNFIILALNTGLRKGEIMGLRWANVNLDDGLICLERAQRKNNKVLRVPLNENALEVLRRLPRVSEYVLCDPESGERVLSFRKAFASACKKAGVKNLRIHDLRHTFGTMLNVRGVDLPTISSLLGHSSITMTSKYITPITEVQKRAVDCLVDARTPERKKDESLGGGNPENVRNSVYIQ
jgi:integrase